MLLHAVSRGLAGLLLLGAGRAAAPQAGRDLSYNASGAAPRSPEVQRASFRVPAGFEVELVAAESPGLGKFIGLVWDARMRLWSMTALEYPVDANENRAESEAQFAHEGFLAAGTPEALVLRPPGAPDRRLARGEVRSSGYLARSLMPEGLLEGLTEPQAADLLAYLLALH